MRTRHFVGCSHVTTCGQEVFEAVIGSKYCVVGADNGEIVLNCNGAVGWCMLLDIFVNWLHTYSKPQTSQGIPLTNTLPGVNNIDQVAVVVVNKEGSRTMVTPMEYRDNALGVWVGYNG